MRPSERKNTINSDVLCASEAQNYGTYNVFVSCSKNHSICHVFVAVPSKNTGIYAVFTMTQDVVFIYEKDQNTLFDHVCFPSATKNRQKIAQRWFRSDFQRHPIILALACICPTPKKRENTARVKDFGGRRQRRGPR